MAKKKNTIPSGFEDVLGSIYSNVEEHGGVTDMNTLDSSIEIPLEEDKKDENPPVKTEDGEKKDDTQNSGHEDESEIPEDVLKSTETKTTEVEDTKPEDNTEPSEADVIEAQQVGLLFDAIGQSLGWNMDDIDEGDRPLTVDALADYFAETVR